MLFPPIEPFQTGRLSVSALHSLYWEQCGNPEGVPVLFLHGGPGGGCSPRHRRFFDPRFYRIVLFDQRGAGQSTPLGEIRENTTPDLITDIERLRETLNIDHWLIFGGSWGSTLGLAYGQAHPSRCLGFILRGIFLCRQSEIDWFVHGMRHVFPEAWRQFCQSIPQDERNNLLEAYAQRLFDPDPKVHLPFARAWSRYESSCSSLLAATDPVEGPDNLSLALARLECHYMRNRGFMEEGALLNNLSSVTHLPCTIIQGRYDMVCPIVTADDLQRRWPRRRYVVVPEAGHSSWEPGVTQALVNACEQMKTDIKQLLG